MGNGKDLDKALGETLRRMREQAGLSQLSAAGTLGVKQPTLSRWESGSITLDTNNIVCAATLYGSTPAQLFAEPAVQEASQEAAPDHVRERAQLLAKTINQRQRR